MRKKTLIAFTAIAMTGSANAATIAYSTYIASGALDTTWVITDTGVGSANFGGLDVNFGGVDWEGSQSNGHPSGETYVAVAGYQFYHSIPGTGWATNNSGTFYPTSPLVSLLHSGTSISGTGVQIDINGLTIGQQYEARLVFADSRNSPSGTNMTITSGGGSTGASDSTQYSYTDGKYLVVTAKWTADALGVQFLPSIDAGQGSILNAMQIVAVPEPSAALLGAIGLFGLLRRKR